MELNRTNRFKDASWFPKDDVECIVGGSGGIGSWLSLFLSRANFKPIIYDADVVEEHNVGGQCFKINSIGKPKVDAIAEVIKELVGEDVTTFNEWYTKDSMASHFMFSGFDNMAARKVFFENWVEYAKEFKLEQDNLKKLNPEHIVIEPLFIDARLGFANLEIYCITLDKVEEYKKTLFDDSEVEDLPCTAKQTTHCAAMIASHMVGFFTNHMHNIYVQDKDFKVPSEWSYIIPLNK